MSFACLRRLFYVLLQPYGLYVVGRWRGSQITGGSHVSDENFLWGGMRTGFPGYGFCIVTGYPGRKFRKKLGRARLEEHVGGKEGL